LGSGDAPISADEPYELLNPGRTVPERAVHIWPEYDAPEVPVPADVRLPETITFPYTSSYYVPQGARNTGIAEIKENGGFG